MNNNGFSLMRYFVDLGEDCTLFLYSNDGTGSLKHFSVENDTFEIAKWRNRIINSKIHNSYFQILDNWLLESLIMFALRLKTFIRRKKNQLSLQDARNVRALFVDYDYIITSGFGPAILSKSNLIVNIFSPYSLGVEGIGRRFYAPKIMGLKSLLHRVFFEFGRYKQIKALSKVDYIVSGDAGITRNTIVNLGFEQKLRDFHYPMVYVEKSTPKKTGDLEIDELYEAVKFYDFVALMHCQLAWSLNVKSEGLIAPKNNNWLFDSFKDVVKVHSNSLLLIVEYGPDIDITKQYILDLGLAENVLWVPRTSRKNLMWLLKHVDVGVGEFIEIERTLWGGAGLEVLATGKPLIHGFLFEDGEYEAIYGHPEPPLLKVKSKEDVKMHLLDLLADKPKAKLIGEASKIWFNTYNGQNLAGKWLDLLDNTNSKLKTIHK